MRMKRPPKTLPEFTAAGGGAVGKKSAAKMEKLKDFVIKLYTETQKKPLSEAQNSMIGKGLHRILPLLNRTPEHPPYAWMILKAIEELGENGDSSEESISDFMKKRYKDLPWAHDTFLNHHLKNLCASGDIFRTNNQTYVLPVLHSFDKSRKKSSKKKHARKKRDLDWSKKKNTKQKRQVGKDYMKQKKDKDHLMIAEERPFREPERQKVPTEVHEINIAEICSSDSQLNPKGQQLDAEAHLIAEHRPPCDSDEQALKKVHETQVVDLDAKLSLKWKKLDDFQTDTSTSDRPPCFGSVLESINLPENSQDFSVVAPELSCTRIEHVNSSVNDELKQVQSVPSEVSETKNQGEEQLQPITTTDIVLQQIECGENRAMLTQVELTEVCNQQTIPELKSTTDETSVSKSQPLHCGGADQVRRIVYQYKKLPPGKKSKENHAKKQRLEEFEPMERVQKQLDEKPLFLLDPQYSKPIDSNENQLLTGSANGSHQELQCKWQDEWLVQETMHQGTWMQRKLHSWKNNSADDPQEKPLKRVLRPRCQINYKESVDVLPSPLDKEEQQQPHRRGRSLKEKPDTISNILEPDVHQSQQTLGPSIRQNQQNTNHLSTGPTQAQSGGATIPVEKHKDEVEYPELLDFVISSTTLKHKPPQKSEFCRRGRPPKFKLECSDSATKPSNTAEEVPHSDSVHILHLEKTPKHQGRGRPRKIETLAYSVINKSLASGNVIHKPGYRGRRGRPRKIIQ